MAREKTEKFKTMIGGQALIEGIMMRGPKKDAIVVRTKEGLELDVKPRKIHKKGSFCTWPLIRGIVGFFDSQVNQQIYLPMKTKRKNLQSWINGWRKSWAIRNSKA